jgi:hypothetical protein
MSARLIKETRELGVILIGTLLLIAVPFGVNGGSAAPFGVVAYGLGCMVLGGCAFGNEFQHRTLALLLSQPISRWAQWRDKMLVLGTSIALSLAALLVCRRLYGAAPDEATWPVLVLIALCAFCGAPYWTLVCRQALIGMVVAVGFPTLALIAAELIALWLGRGEAVQPAAAGVLLTLYCAVVFWRGYVRFNRLEIVETAGRDLHLPASVEAALARPLGKVSARFRGPYAALLKKELRLQQPGFLVAGVFFFIAVIGFCTFLIYHPLGVGILGGDFATFMVVLPLIIGAIAVAEEKGWGIFEWQLTLPPSAFEQWSAKMLVTLPTSLGLGLLLPAIMFLAGEALLPRDVPRAAIPPLSDLALCVLAQLLLTSVAVYAGSFSKTTLWAIITALGILVVGFCVIAVAHPPATFALRLLVIALLVRGHSLDSVVCVSLLLLLALTQWFAWYNFQRAGRVPRLIIAQLLLLLFVAALGANAILVAQMAERMIR